MIETKCLKCDETLKASTEEELMGKLNVHLTRIYNSRHNALFRKEYNNDKIKK